MRDGGASAARAGLLLLVMLLPVAACGDASKGGSVQPQGNELELTLGTKDFTEQFLLGELYQQALAAAGYDVTLRKDIGSTEVIDQELTSGKIDAYPEYLGVAVTVVAGKSDAGTSAEHTYRLARGFYAQRGQALSEQTPFENVDAIATTQYFAQQKRLTALPDLRRLPSFTLGARPEFEDRAQGLAGLREVYGLDNAEFQPLEIGEQYQALDDGKVDTANVFTTDGQLAAGGYRLLEDPERLFGFQHVALVIDEEVLDRLGGDSFMSVVDTVNRRLTRSAMIEMNRDVGVDGQDEALVAERFLTSAGLLEAR
jgi:glycine betaine/choline ABC-type transport system substrate-binding protein